MPKVKVNDIEMYYEVHGEGTPLIMTQGYSGSSQGWKPELIQGLANQLKVIIFDNRGTGRSDKPDIEYSIKNMADDLAGLMEAIDIPRAHVLGLSMGGLIAQEIALSYPERVQSLILCSTSCRLGHTIGTHRDFLEFIENAAKGRLTGLSPDFILEMCYTSEYLQDNKESLLESMASSEYPTPPVGYIRQAQAILNFDSCERLPQLNTRCLVLAGERDILSPPDNSRFLAKHIPNVKMKIFKNAAHLFLSEIPDLVIEEILEFV
jgi:pimeloyl-ACP methyl ester carboxylesterase